jgi:RNA polymerase sigma-70 factor (ECF subfamily)
MGMNMHEPPTTSPTLLKRLAMPGADEAWDLFLERYGPLIEARCRQVGLQAADADDVRAAVLARLVPTFRRFRHDPSRRFRGYLQRAVDNAIRSHWRAIRQRPGWIGTGGEGLDEIPAPLAGLGAEIDHHVESRVEAAWRVMARLERSVGEESWRAFELTAIEGLSGVEAAARLQKDPSAIYAAKSRVLKRLRAEIECLGDNT